MMALLLGVVLSAGPASQPGVTDEAALKALDQAFVAAFNKKDVEGVLRYYADDAVVMAPGPALWYRGKEEIRKGFTEMLAAPGSVELKIHDATYKVTGNLAYGWLLWDMVEKDAAGKTRRSSGRATEVFEKRNGKWLAVVDHVSVPLPAEPAPEPAAEPAPEPGK